MERQFRLEEENVFSNKGSISCDIQSQQLETTAPCPGGGGVPRIPSPATPLIKLSTQFTCCCPSRTTIGCPSCKTLCIVIRALNVWTSSARTGCLEVCQQQPHPHPLTIHVHFHASPEGRRGFMIPCIDDATANMFPCDSENESANGRGGVAIATHKPAYNSKRGTQRTFLRLGAVSSIQFKSQ